VADARTLRFNSAPNQDVRRAVMQAAPSDGIVWRDDPITGRTYALVTAADEVSCGCDALYERPIIALAVRPNPAEALPHLLDAMGGAGRPAGVVACDRIGEEIVIEWDPQMTPVTLIRTLLQAEVGRFGGSYVSRTLAPLPLEVVATIASQGLATPEISADRVLEVLVDRAYGRP
jgi:hypothetical protein